MLRVIKGIFQRPGQNAFPVSVHKTAVRDPESLRRVPIGNRSVFRRHGQRRPANREIRFRLTRRVIVRGGYGRPNRIISRRHGNRAVIRFILRASEFVSVSYGSIPGIASHRGRIRRFAVSPAVQRDGGSNSSRSNRKRRFATDGKVSAVNVRQRNCRRSRVDIVGVSDCILGGGYSQSVLFDRDGRRFCRAVIDVTVFGQRNGKGCRRRGNGEIRPGKADGVIVSRRQCALCNGISPNIPTHGAGKTAC